MTLSLAEDGERIIFEVRVQPRASRTELAGPYGEGVKVRLQAPPVEGRANEALAEFLAERLGIAVRDVEIVSGHGSRSKRVAVQGVAAAAVRRALEAG